MPKLASAHRVPGAAALSGRRAARRRAEPRVRPPAAAEPEARAVEADTGSEEAHNFALLRRAIAGRDQDAWAACLHRFRPAVLASLRRQPVAIIAAESDDYWVNRAFERFWSAVTPDRLGQFTSLGALLRYLQLCCHSVVLDELRVRRRTTCASLSRLGEDVATTNGGQETVVAHLSASALWDTILAVAQDEPERLVADLALVRGLKPAGIQAAHPAHFPSVADVYRTKRNLLERLRRHPGVLQFLG
jgi:hypothetical protein